MARIYRIAGRAGDIGHYIAVLADERIDYRRLSGVGTANNGKTRYALKLLLGVVLFGKILHHLVEQVACAEPLEADTG